VRDASIDHVLSFEVFQHIPAPGPVFEYLAEVQRVLVPGGTFQLQLRRGSDSRAQAQFRDLPEPWKVPVARLLRLGGRLRVAGSVDTWIGCVIDPVDVMTTAEGLGFVDLAVLPDTVHAEGMGYWVIGRAPA
jgi:hypothetical protein